MTQPNSEAMTAERALENLTAVLCDPEGRCCIAGSDGDRRVVDEALATLRSQSSAGGEAVAWELRAQYEPQGKPGPWSKWQRCDRDEYDAVMRGEGYFEYRNAEARALYANPQSALAPVVDEAMVERACAGYAAACATAGAMGNRYHYDWMRAALLAALPRDGEKEKGS